MCLELLDSGVNAEVALVQGNHIRLLGELRVECPEFFFKNDELFEGVFFKAVNHEQERVCTFDMLEELVTETLAFAGTFQKTRNVSDHKAVTVQLHNAEYGFERGEGVVANFRAATRNLVHETGLACVRESDEAYICHELQFQEEFAFFALFAGGTLARGLVGRRCKMLVAHAALSAASGNPFLTGFGKVCEDSSFGIFNDGAARNIYNQVFGTATGAALGSAGLATLRLVQAGVAHVEERRKLLVHLQNYMTAATAVAAIGTAEGYELFAVETANAIAAFTGAHFN